MRSEFRHPVRLTLLGFLMMVVIGTFGLMLPLSKSGPGRRVVLRHEDIGIRGLGPLVSKPFTTFA
ncbi:exported protein of unknown function [Pseudorhizobium banfieldiae]|uniref:Uncharacterized protein n=1 Tax=Pseudorhizobium banfieldiae TaxID=1125847 RepID=L0NH62_9HYPH|nr:exported protein of unknown function [Pseudorhizobium banfieldiae]